MHYAIFSDLHDNNRAFRQVLQDAEAHHADCLICLGDIGYEAALLGEVRSHTVACTFGNWEVSGLARLAEPFQRWVAQMPATVRNGELSPGSDHPGDIGANRHRVIFCHATPEMPAATATTETAGQYMRDRGVGWSELFPRLDHNDAARWNALATLETLDLRAAFHGHTHRQMVWAWAAGKADPTRRQVRSLTEPLEFALERGNPAASNRYLIGIGSAGAAEDGPAVCYALYDEETAVVRLRRLPMVR